MFNKKRSKRTSIKVNKSTQGETIEAKVRRIVLQNEPIEDGAPIIFAENEDDEVNPATDIRTDRWDMAIKATTAIEKANLAKKEGTAEPKKEPQKKGQEKSDKGGPKPDTPKE